MSRDYGVRVAGLNEMVRAMEKAGVDLDELKDVMARISDEAAQTMRSFVPTKTGKLKATVRGNRAKGKAVVTVGSARVRYAQPIQWGWYRRNIRPAGFVEKTDAAMDDTAVRMLQEGWQDIAERHGLS